MGFLFWLWIALVGCALTAFLLQKKLLGLPPIAFEAGAVILLLFCTGWNRFTPMLYVLVGVFAFAAAVDPYLWRLWGICRVERSVWIQSVKLNAKLCVGGVGAFFLGMLCRKLLTP